MPTERHSLLIGRDGTVTVPDLAEGLTPLAAALGLEPTVPLPSRLGAPRLAIARAILLPVGPPLEQLPEPVLWLWHARGAAAYRRLSRSAPTAGRSVGRGGIGRSVVTWLDIKIELARRLLGPPCRLCARACPVDRRSGGRGVCGLGEELVITQAVALWGEEEELGRPGLGLFVGGCGLRCRWCYKPENLAATTADSSLPRRAGERSGADGDHPTHLHFLGGNPDESLPGILSALRDEPPDTPVAWNSHSYLTPPQVALLEGVADAVIADLKFGPEATCASLAGLPDYWPAATRALERLAAMDLRLVVRHVAVPGHLDCCARPAVAWAREHLPRARVRALAQYAPMWRAAGAIGRALNEEERRQVANLVDDPPRKGLPP